MNNPNSKLDHLPGLDGLRALAAMLVIFTHWPNNSISLKFGWIGVNIFFVLSGFLITRILLHERSQPFKSYISRFFIKRTLRIFPVYYLFFILTAATVLLISATSPTLGKTEEISAGVNALKHATPWYLTYTYNIRLNLRYFFGWEGTSNHFFGHLWSLSLEEQFYLIFPFIVYFSSLRTLKIVIISIIILCPILRLLAAVYAAPMVTDKYWLGELLYTNTLCQADALAMGAALAVFPVRIIHAYRNFFITATVWLVTGLVCFYFLRKAGYFLVEGKSFGYNFPGFWFEQKTPWWFINIRAAYQYTLVNLLAVALIAPATVKQPLFPKLFMAKPVSYLGRISYGVYLFHNPVIALFIAGGSLFGGWFVLTANPIVHLLLFALYMIIVVSLAHLSYRYFETKIMKQYRPKFINE